jgi:DNA-binding MarR family transcriptional regulator
MPSPVGGRHDRPNDALGKRIAASWTEIRRGAATAAVREYLFGTGDDRLDRGQMDTLDLLARRPTWRMSELAEALRVDPSTATRAVQRLVNVDMAVRRPSEDDGRVVMVEITEPGRARHAVVAERRMVLMNHMLGAFSPAERQVLAEMLERFIAAVDEFVEGLGDDEMRIAT